MRIARVDGDVAADQASVLALLKRAAAVGAPAGKPLCLRLVLDAPPPKPAPLEDVASVVRRQDVTVPA
jgi:hypothetical protein